jgi:hypothetical protein
MISQMLSVRRQILAAIDDIPTTRAERDKLYKLLKDVDAMIERAQRLAQ